LACASLSLHACIKFSQPNDISYVETMMLVKLCVLFENGMWRHFLSFKSKFHVWGINSRFLIKHLKKIFISFMKWWQHNCIHILQ